VIFKRCAALGVLICAIAAAPSRAAIIEYDVTNVIGSTWRYEYFVTNDTLPTPINELTIWFDLGLMADLSNASAPAGWDSLVIQPDPLLPDDGFYDVLALGAGIGLGETLGGFFVEFSWLGAGTPGSQLFDVVDANTFDILESGMTVLRERDPGPVDVPEPGSAGLLLAGAMMFGSLAICRARPRAIRRLK
jgi:hypothetical protein